MDSQMLSSMNTDLKQLIHQMIFEHGCKHNMPTIIQNGLKDEEFIELLKVDLSDSTIMGNTTSLSDRKIRPIFLFTAILKIFSSSLENCLSESRASQMLSWNKKSLNIIIELLSSTYQKLSFLSLKEFTTLISQLKLLDLISLLVEKVPSKFIVQKLNIFFPRWTPTLESSIKSCFKLTSLRKLEKIKDSHIQCRRLILRFAASDECRNNYVANKCSDDLKNFLGDSISHLKQAIVAIEKNAGPSQIEELIDGNEKHFSQSDDPATQIFLEYLHPCMKEKDFFRLMHALEPSAASQQSISFATCLQPFDIFSDTCSEAMSEPGTTDSENIDGDSETDDESDNSHDNSNLNRTVVKLTAENIFKCMEEQSSSTSDRTSVYGTPLLVTNTNTPSKLEDMEIVADSEGEMFGNSCQSPESNYPKIQDFLVNVNIKPCIVKLYHENQVVRIGPALHNIFA